MFHTKMKSKLFLLFILMALMTAACSNENNQSANPTDVPSEQPGEQKLQVVTSFYPIYFMVQQIGGEYVEVNNLIATGVEPHDWTPKSKDLLTATNADLLLYHGAGLETWVDDFVEGLQSDSDVNIVEVSKGISLISGAELEEDEHSEHGHDHDEHDHSAEEEHAEHSHDHSTDPHTWTSPKSALELANNIKNSLIEADPEHEEQYEQNFGKLKASFVQLDHQYTEQLADVKQRNIVVSHQSFGYLAKDYGLNQVSIMGLSPNAEPRAQDILEIAKFVKENDIKYIFFEEMISSDLAEMLANEANVSTLVLHSLEGLTTEQEAAGDTYLTLMEENLQNLIQALQ